MTPRFLSITLILSSMALIGQVLLTGWSGGVGLLIEAALFAFLFVGIFSLFGSRDFFLRRVERFTLIFLSIQWVFVGIVLAFCLYSWATPSSVWKIILTNQSGSQIVFYQMAHIGRAGYYDDLARDLANTVWSGSLVFVEWVHPGTPEENARFEQFLWIKTSEDMYDEIARLSGLIVQDASLYRWVQTWALRSVDLGVTDLLRSIPQEASMITSWEVSTPDIAEGLSGLDRASPIVREYFLRSLLNLMTRVDVASVGMDTFLDGKVWEVILDKRNDFIVKTYLELTQEEKRSPVIMTYGALHFEGVYSGLKRTDPSWKIESITPFTPFFP